MKKKVLKLKNVALPPSPFSHVVMAGNFIFLSSQLSADLKTNKIISGNIKEQTSRALNNIKLLLESVGSNLDSVVKVTVYMRDVREDFKAMNEVYRSYFPSGEEPARVTVQAISPIEGVDIEIDVIAVRA
jgi:2-iminobutanoate/2-iminopropanoate deaminase